MKFVGWKGLDVNSNQILKSDSEGIASSPIMYVFSKFHLVKSSTQIQSSAYAENQRKPFPAQVLQFNITIYVNLFSCSTNPFKVFFRSIRLKLRPYLPQGGFEKFMYGAKKHSWTFRSTRLSYIKIVSGMVASVWSHSFRWNRKQCNPFFPFSVITTPASCKDNAAFQVHWPMLTFLP